MNPSFFLPSTQLVSARRRIVTGAVLSAGAVALLGGRDAMAASRKTSHGDMASDVHILNTALGAELEAIAAYQVGAESGLLTAAVKPVALEFQGHHKAHAAALAGTVKKLGGTIVKVQIDELRDSVFHGSVYVRNAKGRIVRLDSRASDAVALGIGSGVPIYVAQGVLDEAGLERDKVMPQITPTGPVT